MWKQSVLSESTRKVEEGKETRGKKWVQDCIRGPVVPLNYGRKGSQILYI